MKYNYKLYKKMQNTTYVLSAINFLMFYPYAYFRFAHLDNPQIYAAVAVQGAVIVISLYLFYLYLKNKEHIDKKIIIYPLLSALLAVAVIVDMLVFPWISGGQIMISRLHTGTGYSVVGMAQGVLSLRPALTFYKQSKHIYTPPKNELQEDGTWKHN